LVSADPERAGTAIGGGMVHRGQIIADDSLTLEFVATAADTEGALHEMRARYAPESPYPPAHHHPAQEERFVVEEGVLCFDIAGRERYVAAGEDLIIPRGTPHRVRNPHAVPAVARWETHPALRTGQFFERYGEIAAAGGLLDLAALVDEFRDVYRPAFGPRPLASAAVKVLAAAGRRRRRR
jgi:mannose-6-phosphate isomerase-like protein (cupin superfamily)